MSNNFINETENGQVFKCSKCKAIHLEYKNLNFNFTEEQYTNFAEYINNLNGKEWENKNKNSQFKRKIIISIGHQSFRVLLATEELEELKRLSPKPISEKQRMITNFKYNIYNN